MPIPVSPLALPLPELEPVAGVRLAVGEAGIRYKGRTDVLLAAFSIISLGYLILNYEAALQRVINPPIRAVKPKMMKKKPPALAV